MLYKISRQISTYETYHDLFIDNFKDPALKAVLKYRYHPGNIAINNKCKEKSFSFSFSEVTEREIAKEISKLRIHKAFQNSDM